MIKVLRGFIDPHLQSLCLHYCCRDVSPAVRAPPLPIGQAATDPRTVGTRVEMIWHAGAARVNSALSKDEQVKKEADQRDALPVAKCC